MSIRIAINGYGRIGRGLHRQLLGCPDIEVVAINSGSNAESHAYLLKYDSLYGKLPNDVQAKDGSLYVDGKEIKVYQIRDPKDVDWTQNNVDIVIEATGHFTTYEDASKHLQAGVKDVVITAPCKDPQVQTLVMGVNDKEYDPAKYRVVSNASCTTNCLAPVMKVLEDKYGVETAFVTTIHAFTYTQNLLDNSNAEDYRRSRATTESIIPTTTGAMKAIGEVIPTLKGKVDGMAFRVPIATVSAIDVVAKLSKNVTVEELNNAFKEAEKTYMQGVLGTSDEELVSIDFKGDLRSSIVDLHSTKVMNENYVKIVSWYDNEWGYIARIVDLIRWISVN